MKSLVPASFSNLVSNLASNLARRLASLGAGIAVVAMIACTGGDDATPTPEPPQASLGAPEISAATLAQAPASPETLQTSQIPQTPQTPWAQDRIAALTEIWEYSPEALAWLQTYDFRQMVAQPTWFGSTGFQGWAGAGQAIPRTIMHEMSHSYWGVFGVEGAPDLEWTRSVAGLPSDGIAAYRADLARFMAQPPDRFEPLRDRFRNLPNLTLEQNSDLFHFGEADMVYMTGGDIDLVPPILRPYYAPLLTSTAVGGLDFAAWPEALTWFQSLAGDDRRLAGEVFGLQHFPLARYEALDTGDDGTLPEALGAVLAAEERQRLRDFEEQFVRVREAEFSLVDAAGVDRGFQFWRGYIGGMRALHENHPEVLPGIGTPLAEELGMAFDFFQSIADKNAIDQAEAARGELVRPIFSDLAVLLPPRALVILFGDDSGELASGASGVLTGYADTLRKIAEAADTFLDAGRSDPRAAALIFDQFVVNDDEDELRTTVPVLVDFLRESEGDTFEQAMPFISDPSLLRLLDIRPELARAPEVTPGRLLGALEITAEAEAGTIAAGAKRLFENGSGNFEIDRPVVAALYALLDEREQSEPGFSLGVVRDASLGLMTWINAAPERALRAIRNDVSLAALLISTRDNVRSTPAGIVHRIIAEDPLLAADLVGEIDIRTRERFAPRVLATLVYDGYWSDLAAGPDVSLSGDAIFLGRLAELNGEDWLIDGFEESVEAYELAIEAGRIEPEYREQHAETLQAIGDAAASDDTRLVLRALARRLK